jgi:CheY-like chemotaxis protein
MKPRYNLLCVDDDTAYLELMHNQAPRIWHDLFKEQVKIDIRKDVVSGGTSQPEISIDDVAEYDAVILDLKWKDRDKLQSRHGISVCELIRSKYPDKVIVVLSGAAGKEHLRRLIELNVAAYVIKQTSFPTVVTSIGHAVRRATLDRSSMPLYSLVEEIILEGKAWNTKTVNEALAAVWLRESPHDKWLGFWRVWTESLAKLRLRGPVDTLKEYFRDNDLLTLSLHSGMRGHLEHVLHVYFTGYVISHRCPSFREAVDSAARNLLGSEYSEKDKDTHWEYFQIAWLVCATLHDTGYSVEVLPELVSKYSGLKATFPFVTIPEMVYDSANLSIDWLKTSGANARLDSFSTLLRSRRPDNWISDHAIFMDREGNRRVNHGVLSAALFLHRLYAKSATLMAENTLLAGFLQWASVAMALHSLKFPGAAENLGIVLKNDPLSALLLLCDELQVWDRERPDENRESTVFSRSTVSEFEVTGDQIEAVVSYIPFAGSTDLTEIADRLSARVEQDGIVLQKYLSIEPLSATLKTRIHGSDAQVSDLHFT